MLEALEKIKDSMLAKTPDEHDREIIERSYIYAASRIANGHATTELEAKLAMAAFGDGFCTGFHRGSGTVCSKG